VYPIRRCFCKRITVGVKRPTPVEGKESLPQEYLIPHNAGTNKLARNFPMPDGEMRRKAEKDFMAGCVRFWEWFPAAASCTHKKDNLYGFSQTCLDYPHQLVELDPDDKNISLPARYEARVILVGQRS